MVNNNQLMIISYRQIFMQVPIIEVHKNKDKMYQFKVLVEVLYKTGH